MFLILIIAGFIAGSCTESTAGTYDYQATNYNAYSHGKSDPTESTATSGVIVSDTGFSPSDSRYSLSGSVSGHDSMSSGYLSGSYPGPTRSSQYSTPLQYSASTYDKSYSNPYSTISATPAAYTASAKQYAPASYSSSPSNADTLAYANTSPSLSGFTGSSGSIGEYQSSHGASALGLRGYVPSASRGSSASDYTSGYLASGGVLSGSAHSSLGGHATTSHIGSNFAGYATGANALGAPVDPAHSYTASSAHVVPGNTISHDYSANEGDVNYGSTNEAQRYAAPAHSSDFAYKDAGYATGSPSVYGAVKGSYLSGGHLGGYSPSSSPYYVRAVDSASHANTAHYSISPNNLGYSSGYKAPFSLSSLYGGGPTKIIYVKDSSSYGSGFPFSLSSLKNKLYSSPSHTTPVYVPSPSSLSGYLSRGYSVPSSAYPSYL